MALLGQWQWTVNVTREIPENTDVMKFWVKCYKDHTLFEKSFFKSAAGKTESLIKWFNNKANLKTFYNLLIWQDSM